jgi:high-affinity iron transporter
MGNALFIVWRESLEAILVISILYAWIGARGDGRIGVRYLWVGVGGGLLLGAGLLVADVERLINLEWLPPLLEPVWDSSAPLDDGGTLGGIASTFAGYRSQPSLMVLCAWGGYWLLVAAFGRLQQRRAA